MNKDRRPQQHPYADLGTFLKRLRLRARLSQEECARRVAASRGAVIQYEAGQKLAPLGLLYRYARVFRVRFDRLCDLAIRPEREAWKARRREEVPS